MLRQFAAPTAPEQTVFPLIMLKAIKRAVQHRASFFSPTSTAKNTSASFRTMYVSAVAPASAPHQPFCQLCVCVFPAGLSSQLYWTTPRRTAIVLQRGVVPAIAARFCVKDIYVTLSSFPWSSSLLAARAWKGSDAVFPHYLLGIGGWWSFDNDTSNDMNLLEAQRRNGSVTERFGVVCIFRSGRMNR